MTLTKYIEAVSAVWEQCPEACRRCDLHDEEAGSCLMLHHWEIPNGNCQALLERDGTTQPQDFTPE